MMDCYEVQIRLAIGESFAFYVDHRLGRFPDVETLRALAREADGTFEALYGEAAQEVSVSVVALPREERAEAEVPVGEVAE